jgi:hypothetical protein
VLPKIEKHDSFAVLQIEIPLLTVFPKIFATQPLHLRRFTVLALAL